MPGTERTLSASAADPAVATNGRDYFGNCVWDAYVIAAALDCDVISRASDGETGEPLTLEVKNNAPVSKPYTPCPR